MPNLIDHTFGLNAQAWALLHAIDSHELEDIGIKIQPYSHSFRTAPWYNGRERGFSVNIRTLVPDYRTPSLTICFAEDRSSDQIVVWHHLGFVGINPFNVDDADKAFWDSATRFDCLDIAAADKYIRNLIQLHVGDKT